MDYIWGQSISLSLPGGEGLDGGSLWWRGGSRVLVTPASCYLHWGGGGQDPDGQSLGWREESWWY